MNNSGLNNPTRYLPDYSAGVSVTKGEFTPTDNGVCVGYGVMTQWPDYLFEVYVGGAWLKVLTAYASTGDSSGRLSGWIIINKKFRYRITGDVNITFYPFIGG